MDSGWGSGLGSDSGLDLGWGLDSGSVFVQASLLENNMFSFYLLVNKTWKGQFLGQRINLYLDENLQMSTFLNPILIIIGGPIDALDPPPQ